MNKKGVALIISFMVIGVLMILSIAMIARSISERNLVQRYAESTQAFWIAEAGINRALSELRSNFNLSAGNNIWSASLGQGEYSIDLGSITGQQRKVTAHGFVPSMSQSRIERKIEVMVSRYIPPYFYDNAIYSAGEVDFNGRAYSVTGDVRYADEIENTGNVNGTITQDASISPLALLDFQQLYDISSAQGNVYNQERLNNIKSGSDSFPSSFWSAQGSDGIDNDADTEIDESDEKVNVVYVETDLELRGGIGTIGGFFVVVGDVITNPGGTYDAEINGNGQIDGVIYTRGEFEVNGGGGGLNVVGGVWAGEETELNGNATIRYNQEYMDAIEALNINVDAQIVSWRDMQNPYTVAP